MKAIANYASLNGLGSLGNTALAPIISSNTELARKALDRSKSQEKSKEKILDFEDVQGQYNQGISEDETIAWVWYKRSIGIPMTGWQKFFIKGTQGIEGEMLVTTQETTLLDAARLPYHTVPEGKVLGKPLDKDTDAGENGVYRVFRDSEGLKMVLKNHSKTIKTGIKTNPKELDRLVNAGALFYLNGELLPLPLYAFGNMYDRELQLSQDKEHIEAKYGIDAYLRHEQVIKHYKPKLLSITNPDPTQRPNILAISQFAKDFHVEDLAADTGITLSDKLPLVKAFQFWMASLDQSSFNESSANRIWNHYIEARRVTDKELSKEQKREVKTAARNEGERLFAQFLHEGLQFEDQQKLDFTWNRIFNGQSSVPYNKIPVGFEASANFKQFALELRPPQREAIAFMELTGSGCIAYDVGVGKTMAAIVTLANAIFSGKAKRPLVVVPNPAYKKWLDEIFGYEDNEKHFVPGVLSHTGIKVNDWFNLGKGIRDKINFDKAVPPKSITVVTFEGFKKIGFSEKIMDEMFLELANIIGQSKEGISERDQEIEYARYEEIVGVGIKDTIADIDTLGIDYVVIDEAHNFKNVFHTVKKDKEGNKRFGIEGQASESGIKAFFLTNYIQRKFGRNVMLLTATPFTNSALEIYSILSLIAYQAMKQMGLTSITRFFETFVQETTEYVVNIKEQLVAKDVIKRFNNRLVLQKLIYNHINYKTGEESGVKRPCLLKLPKVNVKENGTLKRLRPEDQVLTYLRMTETQRQNQLNIVAMAKEATATRKTNTAMLFQALNLSLDNALSPFIYEGTFPETYKEFIEQSPKLLYAVSCIASHKKYHEDRGEPISGALIYMNRGKAYFEYIQDWLFIETGFKREVKWGRSRVSEVEIISSGISQGKKEVIKQAFLAGVVKVIIGTATVREGIDLQTNGTLILNCYPDWNPTNIQQLDGRMYRPGNRFGWVRSVMPLVQDSMDVFVFQKLEEKTARINDIWYKADRGNVLDLEALDPEEVKFALITDVEAIVDLKIKGIKAEMQRKYDRLKAEKEVMTTFKNDLSNYNSWRSDALSLIEKWKNTIAERPHIKNPPNAKQRKAMEADEVRVIDLNQSVFEDILRFLESVPQVDTEILRVLRRIRGSEPTFTGFNVIANFKEYLGKIRKAEKTVLAKRGFDLDTDIEEPLSQIEADISLLKAEAEKVMSDTFRREIKAEVDIKKSAMNVDGKTIGERVAEFASTNYLLSFKFEDIDPFACEVPNPANEREPDTIFSNMGLLKIKAKALTLKLKLEQFNLN